MCVLEYLPLYQELSRSNSMQLDSLQSLYIERLHDLHTAELRSVKALPRLQMGVTRTHLKDAFSAHLEKGKQQIARLQRISAELGISAELSSTP